MPYLLPIGTSVYDESCRLPSKVCFTNTSPCLRTKQSIISGRVDRMRRRLLRYLACQADGCFPMDLYVFEEKGEVVTGVLFCTKCCRWYPIRERYPEILPDNARVENDELSFLRKWRKVLPQKVLTIGKPFSIRQAKRLIG